MLTLRRLAPVPSLLFLALGLVLLSPRVDAGAESEPAFVRGDANQDRAIDISDGIAVLFHLFRDGFDLPCRKAADVNDSGAIDISDAVYELAFLFTNGPPPPPPFERCGVDPTVDALDCLSPPCVFEVGSLVISEIMASNRESLLDEDGESSDWIELHLQDTAADDVIDLEGWFLTDDPTLTQLWEFPAGVSIARGAYLVVFASGKNRAVAGEELHTDFRFDADGDYAAIVAPDGVTIVDEIAPAYPEQLTDISYGRGQSSERLVGAGDTARYLVPRSTDSGLGVTWTQLGFDASSWSTGDLGFGFSGVATEGFEVTFVKANIAVDHLTVAEEVLANPARQSRVVEATASVIDYFNSGGRGNYSNDNAFPSIGFVDTEDFVIEARATVLIPQAGSWSFGVNSDDGFGFEMTDGTRNYNMSFPAPRGPNDTIQVFNIVQAGPHEIRLVFYERGGGAGVELFAAQGARTTFNPTNFRLVGDTDGGGLGLLGFSSQIGTDLGTAMRGVNASLWVRSEFDVAEPDELGGLVLRMQYEDGFIAYLNGQEVARRNAPASPAWNSRSSVDRPIGDVGLVEEINLTSDLGLLRRGGNVLAVHGLNDASSNADFLLVPELIAAGRGTSFQYMEQPTPGRFNSSGALDFVRRVEFSVEHGFYTSNFSLALSTPTSGAQIRYTRDGSTPTASSGSIYSSPISITGTSTIRAAAFKPSHLDSLVTTRTYLFLDDVIRQSPSGAAPGPGWPTSNVNGQYINYGMDPDVVNDGRWSGDIEEALLQISSISLVTDLENFFSPSTGIYVNAGNDGRAWERRTSVELLNPDGSPGFTVDAGVRIRGAFSRSDGNPKHSLRLFFRSEYGAGKLRHPMFGGEGVDEFDKLDLRTSQNYSWAFQGSNQNTFMRDVFSRDVMRDLRQPYTRSRYYHLYLNGVYWGLYQTEERADADFAESYLGGKAADYDVIKNDSSGGRALHATDGTIDAYRRLYDAAVSGFSSNTAYLRVLGLRPDRTVDPAGEKLVDAQNVMDYMICTYYTGDPDAPISAWAHFSNNIFAIYDRTGPKGFKWFRHDAEHSLGANGGLNEGRLLTDPTDRSIGQLWQHFNPAWLHLRLGANAEYAIEFADRVNAAFFHNGPLSPNANIARWNSRRNEIDLAVIGASARWGDAQTSSPRTKAHWDAEVGGMVTGYFPQRTQIVLNQMRSVNMFPSSAIVTFNRQGGEVSPGFNLRFTQSNGTQGTIYYTTNGEDPRQWGGAIHPSAQVYPAGSNVPINATTTVRARVRAGTVWGAMTEARFWVGISGLVINEVLAENDSINQDPAEPGEYPDWIELFNGTSGTIDLGGMYLTDDPTRLTKWRIANGVLIDPGERVLFFADDDGTQGPFHTNFQLSSSGETVTLVDVDGKTVIDSIVFDQQSPDVSYGRFPDGGATWGFHPTPTPLLPNSPHAP